MDRYQWSKSYGEAMRNQRTIGTVRINIAAIEVLRGLLDIGTDAGRRMEKKEILCALSDRQFLIHLHRKYAQSALIQR